MELDLLQIFGGFGVGVLFGVIGMLVFNKIRSGSASAAGLKKDYDTYKTEVEAHFEETSKKFQNMTEQYQDLYQHLAVGATTLCRPDSVAAGLVDDSNPNKPAQIEADSSSKEADVVDAASQSSDEEPQPGNKEPQLSDKEPQLTDKEPQPENDSAKSEQPADEAVTASEKVEDTAPDAVADKPAEATRS